MSNKLYYSNPYCKNFTANITDIHTKDGKHHIVLDQTAFYPEGGGQPCDLGLIDNLLVEYVYEEENKIFHVTSTLPQRQKDLYCEIQWERRFDHMQQHLGQHILSTAFEKLYQAETIGFHLGSENVTIDIDMKGITPEQINHVESLANQIIFKNVPVKQLYPTPDQLEKLPLRKPPKVNENIRIIEVDGFDFSPCGGTHPEHTGEVGIVKIKKWEKYKDGVRIEFLCGNRACLDYQWKNYAINRIANLLSIKDVNICESVEKLYDQTKSLKKEVSHLKDLLSDYEALDLYLQSQTFGDIRIIQKKYEGRDIAELRILAAKIVTNPKVIVLFGSVMDDKAQLLFSRSDDILLPMNDLFKQVISIIEGKGGGNAVAAQGGGSNISDLDKALSTAHSIVTETISNIS
ncbi:MAG: alanyl-tRNA editing protein [Bacillota bacterium]